MDNFEWAWGYDKRFGIVRVDFDSQLRSIKDSGYFYRDVVASNALPPLPSD
jgi:beta-glucosidase